MSLSISDFTRTHPPEKEEDKYNLLICNPPYVRHHHLTPDQKKELRFAVHRHAGVRLSGLTGLYAYFMLLSTAWMTTGGIGAWLVPSEFMDVNYGRAVKQFLLKQVTLRRVHRFRSDSVQFDDALVSSAVLLFENAPPPPDHEIRFDLGGTLARPDISEPISSLELSATNKWTRLPRTQDVSPPKSGHPLNKLFDIKRGIATGCNKFFVLSPEEIEEWNLPSQFLVPLLPSPRFLKTDEVLADERGDPKVEKKLFLLSCDLPETILKKKYPALWKYLRHGKELGVDQRYLSRHRTPWYSQETRAPAPLLCTYMGRSSQDNAVPFRFILNHSRAVTANVYLLLYPKPFLAPTFQRNPELLRRTWAILRSLATDALTGEGRVYGGGLHKLEPKELGNVSVAPIVKLVEDVAGGCLPVQPPLFSERETG